MAHQPHDVIDALAMSPDYENDGLVLLSVTAGIYSTPMRSTDGGVTFLRIMDGMDNSGIINTIAYSPRFSEDGAVYMSSSTDGIYRSLDRGLSFEKINGNLPTLRLHGVTVGVDDAGNRFLLAALWNGGLVRSTDEGTTWQPLPDIQGIVTSAVFTRLSDGTSLLFVGTVTGQFWRSVDDGQSFELMHMSPIDNAVLSINFAPEFETTRTLCVGTQKTGVLISKDGGETFTSANRGLLDRWVNDVEFSPDFAVDQTMFACTFNLAVYRSTDGGRSWELYPHGIRYQDQYGIRGHFYEVEISPSFATDGIVMLGAWEGFYLSTDRGEFWVESETRPTASITGLALSPSYPTDERLIMTRYGGGIAVSNDLGANWQSTNIGIRNPYVYDLAISPEFDRDDTAFALHLGVVARSTDSGNTWTTNPIAVDRNVFPKSLAVSDTYGVDRTVFVGSRLDGVFRSTDGGDTWTQVFFIPQLDIVEVDLAPDYARSGIVMIGVVDAGVFVSRNRGETWRAANSGLDDLFRVRPRFAPTFNSDGLAFAASSTGLFRGRKGESWARIDGPSEVATGNIEYLEFSPDFAADGEIYASVRGRGLYRSTDRGNTWSPMATDLFDAGLEVKLITFSPHYATDNTIFAASDAALWRSIDRGDTWTVIPSGSVRYENYNQQILTGNGWEMLIDPMLSAGDAKFSTLPGATATFTFLGSSVTWIGARSPRLGFAEVYLDGALYDTLDLYDEEVMLSVPVMTIDGLDPSTRHTLDIVVINERNPDSIGYGALIDAFDVVP